MAKPEPVLEEPRRAAPGAKPGVATDAGTPTHFDPKESFFPQALLRKFDDAPAPAARPPVASGKFRTRDVSLVLLGLVALVLVGWAGARWMRGPAVPVAAEKSAPPRVAAAPIRTTPAVQVPPPAVVPVHPAVVARPAPAARPAAAAAPESPQPQPHYPSAVVPVAAATMPPGISPVTHTRNAVHAPPPAPANEQEKPAPAAPAPDCARPIAALGLCGNATERKSR
ncbi:MAG TPA: hypothetical protein VFE23_10030 [Usitatibacter sp.]|jgi:hypothetical protein|nr:hypothetical protein [Usitatibacter sp.]